MGEHELQNALRREAGSRIHALWAEAETEVARQRATLAAELDSLQREFADQVRAESLAVRRLSLAATAQAERHCRLLAETSLAERLRGLARQVLVEMAAADRERSWQASVAGLPEICWESLLVAAADAARARRDFPQAAVEIDDDLLGGVIATAANGRIVIDNSLAGRLARGWPELLPELLAALVQELNRDETAGPATAR